MNQSVFLLKCFIILILWKQYLLISLAVPEYTSGSIVTYKIPQKGDYEITIGGACGGGTNYGDGGYGGMISGLFNFEGIEQLSIAVGGSGVTKNDKCGTAGGGGATSVFVTRGGNTLKDNLILVAPGGGGAGYYQSPASPDYNELNDALDNQQCSQSDAVLQAATGRDINNYLHLVNLTYNPTVPNQNYTPGCLGGFGGGGQGGFMWKLENYTVSAGGGGGGGGFIGGRVSVGGKTNGCTAGGPGTPKCINNYCGVPKSNPSCLGYFVIRKHELYKELPLKDRTNYERPRVDRNVGLGSSVLSISLNILISGLMWNMLYKQSST